MRKWLLILVAAAIVGCRPAPTPPAPDSVVVPAVADSSAAAVEDDDQCGFVAAHQDWTPTALVTEYVHRDADGEFLSTAPWLDSALTCAGHLPGWDASEVINDFRIARVDSSDRGATVAVEYDVLGSIVGGEGFAPRPETRQVTFVLVRTPSGWRIDAPQLPPHVRARAIIAKLHLNAEDAALIEATTLPVPSRLPDDRRAPATLLFDGTGPDGRFEGERYLLVQDVAGGGSQIVPLELKTERLEDNCTESAYLVPRFPGAGKYFAVRVGAGLTPGAIDRWVARRWYVEPGDSVLVSDDDARPMLRATGFATRHATGTSYTNYIFVLEVTVQGKRERLLLWTGDFGDTHPNVKGVGDLNRDGFPDVLIDVPIGGYSTETRLLLSAREGDHWVFRLAGRQTHMDC